MAKWIIALALTSVAFPSGWGQTKDMLVGTWKLISATDTTEKGEVKDSFGRNPAGFLTYTNEGRMMGMITFDGRKPLSVPDYISAPAQERPEAFATFYTQRHVRNWTGYRNFWSA